MAEVAVLFARADSVYKTMPECDVWDLERDARRYQGPLPVVAHPPCRAWGRLRHFAKPRSDERELAIFAIEAVRRCGGALEHPWASSLWKVAGLPAPGTCDRFGGWTIGVRQGDWGHTAPKLTWLYVVGVHPVTLQMPFELGFTAVGRVHNQSKADRERTPVRFAQWLVDLASRAAA